MKTEKLIVSSLVNFQKEDYDLAKVTISELKILSNTYSQTVGATDPRSLDELKRQFVSHMSNLTDVYAKVKAFKGSNHSYLEDARKQFKAETLKILINDEGCKITEAKETAYAHPYYMERITLTEKIRSFFIEVDEMHEFFTNVLSLMQQTISIVSKDFEYNRHTK
jgi:hypothetical protein